VTGLTALLTNGAQFMEVIMSGKRYTDEFKSEAVRQVTDRGYPVTDVAHR